MPDDQLHVVSLADHQHLGCRCQTIGHWLLAKNRLHATGSRRSDCHRSVTAVPHTNRNYIGFGDLKHFSEIGEVLSFVIIMFTKDFVVLVHHFLAKICQSDDFILPTVQITLRVVLRHSTATDYTNAKFVCQFSSSVTTYSK